MFKSISLKQVGEFACVVCTSSRDVQLCLAILNLWLVNRSYKIYSPLDVVAISVEASAAPTKNVFKPVKCRGMSLYQLFVKIFYSGQEYQHSGRDCHLCCYGGEIH